MIADHGLSASAFAATVVVSTLSSLLYALEAAISALQGPLHGGALEKAACMLGAISLGEVEEYVSRKLARKEKLMGFGHRVYKTYDPRAKLLKRFAAKLVTDKEGFGSVLKSCSSRTACSQKPLLLREFTPMLTSGLQNYYL